MPTHRQTEETFTTAEVAVILTMADAQASITRRAVEGVIVKEFFPSSAVKRRDRQRTLTATGLMIMATEFTLRRELPVAALRKRIYQTMLRQHAAQGRIAAGDTITVNVEAPLARASEALNRYRRLMELVEVNPEIQHGEPVLRGTRVTVYTIAALAEAGTPIDEILRHYPSLSARQIEAARLYASAHPRRNHHSLPGNGRVLLEMKIPELNAF